MTRAGVFIRFAGLVFVPLLAAQSITPKKPKKDENKAINTATEIRLLDPGWWPTKGTPAREEYIGSAACAKCHGDKAQTQPNTPMAHALSFANSAASEDNHRPLHFSIGSYNYEVAHTSNGATYSVSNGSNSMSVPLVWVFGTGQFSRTYLYVQDGAYYESRLSFYRAIQGLDFTAGSPRSAPNRIETALGRRMSPDEPPLCFGCHTTVATTKNRFDPNGLIPGITCEACHGPGAQHVAAVNLGTGDQTATLIMNPARLAPKDSVDFCGACHRTSVDVALSGVTGILTLRFPAYRLQRSRCWGTGDARLVCTACHDPHKPLVSDAAPYDKECLSCHVSKAGLKPTHDRPGAACPVADKACVSCHMPKFNIPEMHTSFTDHRIRIHREGEAFTE